MIDEWIPTEHVMVVERMIIVSFLTKKIKTLKTKVPRLTNTAQTLTQTATS